MRVPVRDCRACPVNVEGIEALNQACTVDVEIYNLLLRLPASPSILRTSKQIHDEGKERLFQEAIFRVKTFPANRKQFEILPFQQLRPDWEYASVSAHVPSRAPPSHTISSLKRECLISIHYGRLDSSTNQWLNTTQRTYPFSLNEKIACLTTFTTMIMV